MLAGSDGIVRIQFYDARMTNYIGTVALAFILFAGGLDTRWRDVRPVLAGRQPVGDARRGADGFVSVFARLLVLGGWNCRLRFWLGVIVSSTDAPAVFMIMRTQKAELRDNLRPLLEFESAGQRSDGGFTFFGGAGLAAKLRFCRCRSGQNVCSPTCCRLCRPAADWDGWREFC